MAGGATTVPEGGATTTKFRPVVERRRSPRAARAAQVAGVIGVIVCLILALVVWLGRGAVHGALDDLATNVDGGFDRAVTAVQSVSDQIDAAGTQVGSIATDADAIVGKVASTDAISRLTTRLASFADSYRTIRIRYARGPREPHGRGHLGPARRPPRPRRTGARRRRRPADDDGRQAPGASTTG